MVGFVRIFRFRVRFGMLPSLAVEPKTNHIDWSYKGQNIGVYPANMSRSGWEARTRKASTVYF